jgi:hypothetical protein
MFYFWVLEDWSRCSALWFVERGGGINDNDSDNEVGMTTMIGVCSTLDSTCNQFSV